MRSYKVGVGGLRACGTIFMVASCLDLRVDANVYLLEILYGGEFFYAGKDAVNMLLSLLRTES